MAPSPHDQLWRWKVDSFLSSPGGSTTPPANPQKGQFWVDDKGATYVWYVDPDSAQWVQVAAPPADLSGGATPITPPPSDGNEYALVNGIWRLKQQTLDLTGKTLTDFAVPAWGPTQMRLTGYGQNVSATGQQHFLRFSGDGTTFEAGATNYSLTGFYHTTGSTGFANLAQSNSTMWPITGNHDNASVGWAFDHTVGITRNPAGYAVFRGSADIYNSAAATLHMHSEYFGWGFTSGTAPLKAYRILSNVAPLSGTVVVEWLQ